jgi:exonuclease VII small subunit
MTSIERFDAVFERDRLGSRRFDMMATLFDQRFDDSNDTDERTEYRKAVVELEQRRIELERSALAYVEGEESSTTLVESVDAVGESYRKCNESTTALEAAVSDVSTSPLLVLWGGPTVEVPKGADVTAELALATVGHLHLDSIVVDVESEMPASVTPSTIASLDANETVALSVELSPPTAGEFDAFVTATGETNADRLQLTVRVLEPRHYVDRAILAASSLDTALDSLKGGGRQNGLRNRARTLRDRLESISDDLEGAHRPTGSIGNRLSAARNSVEAMERKISSLERSAKRQKALYIPENIGEGIDSAVEALS